MGQALASDDKQVASRDGGYHQVVNPSAQKAEAKSVAMHEPAVSSQDRCQAVGPGAQELVEAGSLVSMPQQQEPSQMAGTGRSLKTISTLEDVGNKGQPIGEKHDPEGVTVCQLRSASQFSLCVQVGDKPMTAVVDSAAEARSKHNFR